MNPEFKKKMRLYGKRASALSTAAQHLHGIWFPDGEKFGPVGRALKRLSRAMSSYKTVEDLYENLRKTSEPDKPPYFNLAHIHDDRTNEIVCAQVRGGLEYVPYGTSGGYGVHQVSDDLILYFIVDAPSFLERLEPGKVDIYASDIIELMVWLSSILWDGVEYGLRVTGSSWVTANERIQNQPSALLYDDDFVKILRKTSLRIRKYLEGGLPRRILLYGPPGTGKTTLAHTMALEAVGNRVLEVPLGTRFSAANMRMMGSRALVVNDVDRRGEDEIRNLMSYLEELQEPTLVICSINVMGKLDPALVRSGRFDEVIFVDYPRREGLAALLSQLAEQYGVEVPVDEVEGIPPAGLRELFHSLSIVGMEEKNIEVARLRFQARLSGDKRTTEFLLGSRMAEGVGYDDPDSNAKDAPEEEEDNSRRSTSHQRAILEEEDGGEESEDARTLASWSSYMRELNNPDHDDRKDAATLSWRLTQLKMLTSGPNAKFYEVMHESISSLLGEIGGSRLEGIGLKGIRERAQYEGYVEEYGKPRPKKLRPG